MDLDFRRPSPADGAAFGDWLDDWRGDAYEPYGTIFARAWTDFDWYVKGCERWRTQGYPPGLTVPLDVVWAFADELLVGELYVFFEPMGGDNHIGYKVRPSLRRRGIASALLRYGLDRLSEREIAVARLTCLATNTASAAVMERAGGRRLNDKLTRNGEIFRCYAIPTAHVVRG